jgi:cell division protein FtsB
MTGINDKRRRDFWLAHLLFWLFLIVFGLIGLVLSITFSRYHDTLAAVESENQRLQKEVEELEYKLADLNSLVVAQGLVLKEMRKW